MPNYGGFTVNGKESFDLAGRVAFAGDVNADGIDDILIGAGGADPNGPQSGSSYVIFGRSDGFSPNFDLDTLDGTNGFTLNGVSPSDFSGVNVATAGDVNGDGIDDILINAPAADPNGSFSGSSYEIFGRSDGFAASIELSSLDGSNGFTLNGVAAGYGASSVASAGDVNDDGIDDRCAG